MIQLHYPISMSCLYLSAIYMIIYIYIYTFCPTRASKQHVNGFLYEPQVSCVPRNSPVVLKNYLVFSYELSSD